MAISGSKRPTVIYAHFLEASELAISASRRPAIIYVHFSKTKEMAISASGRPAVIYMHFLSWLYPVLRGLQSSEARGLSMPSS